MRKEWSEISRNRVTMWSMIIPSVLFVCLPLVAVYLTGPGGPLEQYSTTSQLSAQDIEDLRHILPQYANLDPPGLTQALTLVSFQSLFLIIPLLVPMIISTFSVIGEKQNRSLEPLLATPIETWELLVGKALAAAVPGFIISWVSYLVLILLSPFFMQPGVYQAVILNPAWIFALLLLSPILAFLAVTLGLIVSSRAQDAQSAQQISGIVVLPVVALLIAQLAGVVQLSVLLVLLAGLVVGLIDVGLIAVAVRLFQRESILTRWK